MTSASAVDPDTYLRSFQPALAAGELACERILITGASGFIGTNLLEFYRSWQAGAVINFDHTAPRNPQHQAFWRKVDICDAGGSGRSA